MQPGPPPSTTITRPVIDSARQKVTTCPAAADVSGASR
jgi:hypothetical protein